MKRFFAIFFIFLFISVYAKQKTWTGTASYYADKFNGRKTASGEKFSNAKFTCANNFLPFGTYIKVTHLKTEKSVIVKVNDRLAGHNKRIVDLSKAAAKKIGLTSSGLAKVRIAVVSKETVVEQDTIENKNNE